LQLCNFSSCDEQTKLSGEKMVGAKEKTVREMMAEEASGGQRRE
jgi:hypothetical protein